LTWQLSFSYHIPKLSLRANIFELVCKELHKILNFTFWTIDNSMLVALNCGWTD
jgi:uncharacterized protein YbcC (UPF0753/DUF2309 family)